MKTFILTIPFVLSVSVTASVDEVIHKMSEKEIAFVKEKQDKIILDLQKSLWEGIMSSNNLKLFSSVISSNEFKSAVDDLSTGINPDTNALTIEQKTYVTGIVKQQLARLGFEPINPQDDEKLFAYFQASLRKPLTPPRLEAEMTKYIAAIDQIVADPDKDKIISYMQRISKVLQENNKDLPLEQDVAIRKEMGMPTVGGETKLSYLSSGREGFINTVKDNPLAAELVAVNEEEIKNNNKVEERFRRGDAPIGNDLLFSIIKPIGGKETVDSAKAKVSNVSKGETGSLPSPTTPATPAATGDKVVVHRNN
jgi:hypothetical protein